MTRSVRNPTTTVALDATVIAFGPLSAPAQNSAKPHRSVHSAHSLSFEEWR